MIARLAFRGVVALVFAFLLLPIAMVVVSSFSASAVMAFPPAGLTTRWYTAISPAFLQALKVSLLVAVGTTVLATLVGTPAALALVRGRLPGKDLIGAFCLSPLMVPTLVIGIATYQFTLVVWDVSGISLGGTITGLILGQTAFTIPFVIRAVIAGQAHFDMALEEAAQSLGATPLQTFFKVTLPLLAPGIVSGAIFAFLMSFDDIPVALYLGGGDATTLPVKIFTTIEFSFTADVMALASLIVFVSIALMVALDRLVGLDRFFGATRA